MLGPKTTLVTPPELAETPGVPRTWVSKFSRSNQVNGSANHGLSLARAYSPLKPVPPEGPIN